LWSGRGSFPDLEFEPRHDHRSALPAREDRSALRHPLDPEEAARALGAATGEGEAEGVRQGTQERHKMAEMKGRYKVRIHTDTLPEQFDDQEAARSRARAEKLRNPNLHVSVDDSVNGNSEPID
jgi:hypothetical protein